MESMKKVCREGRETPEGCHSSGNNISSKGVWYNDWQQQRSWSGSEWLWTVIYTTRSKLSGLPICFWLCFCFHVFYFLYLVSQGIAFLGRMECDQRHCFPRVYMRGLYDLLTSSGRVKPGSVQRPSFVSAGIYNSTVQAS